jgi:SAM-dependent MidA family methyltransferase
MTAKARLAAALDPGGGDVRWEDSEPRLVAAIRDEILAAPEGRITFARFMERALTEPGLGYYATSPLRPTREGDFLTAPELHPFFGRCLGRFVEAAWRRSGNPSRFLVREHGGGRGTLRATALDGLAADASPLAALVAWQLSDLPGRSDATAEGADVVLANELLDALPAHRLVGEGGGLREAYVGWQEGWFCEVLGAVSDPALAAHLAAEGTTLADGQRVDVSLAVPRWVGGAASSLREGGVLLVIDFGYEAEGLRGARGAPPRTLRTYRRHRAGDDPLRAVGHADIAMPVDIGALSRAAHDAGLHPLGRTSQARFLAELGLGELLEGLGRDPATDPADYIEARSAVARLLDPRHLGAFVVLAWERPPGRGCRSGGRSRRDAPRRGPEAGLPGLATAD